MTKYFVFVNITHKCYVGRAQFHMDDYVHIILKTKLCYIN